MSGARLIGANAAGTLAQLPGFNAAGLAELYRNNGQGLLQVLDDGRYRALLVDGCVQSVLDRQQPARPCLAHCQYAQLLLLGRPASLLMAGLGGGDLLRTLAAPMAGAECCAVEYSGAVIDVYKRYFATGQTLVPELCQGDIRDVIDRCQRRYDAIVLDIFSGQKQPEWLQSEDFYRQLHGCLNSPGQLLINFLARDQAQLLDFALMLRRVFARRLLFVPLPECENILLIAYKGAPPIGSNQQLQQALEQMNLALPLAELQAVNICSDDGELALWAERD